jgi:hypothetical protein
MSEQEFDLYLKLLARCLDLTGAQREQIADELRDHLEERLGDLADAGVPREQAILQALDEFGDAAVLAARFSTIARLKRRRFLMRLSLGSVVAVSAGLLIALAFWPVNEVVPVQMRVAAQEKSKPALAGLKKEKRAPAKFEQPVMPAPLSAAANTSKELLSLEAEPVSKAQMRIEAAMNDPVDFTIDPQSLKEAVDFIKTRFQIPILMDDKTLEQAGIDPSTAEVKIAVPGIKLRNMFKLLLEQLPQPLTYVIEDEVMKITTVEKANEKLLIVVYDCRDLQSDFATAFGQYLVRSQASKAWAPSNPGNKEPTTEKKGSTKTKRVGGDGRGAIQGCHRGPSLANFIEDITGPRDNWEKPASITEVGGLLIARNTSGVHEKIKDVLASIRRVKKDGAFANLGKKAEAEPK